MITRLVKISILIISIYLHGNSWAQVQSKTPADSLTLSALKNNFSFIIANDLGQNGYYHQKPVAEMMGLSADLVGAKFIAAVGDIFHFMGVQSIYDPLWLTNFELIYTHPSLMIPWYPALGNHEYRGNTQAIVDYSNISRRWQMPAKYYSKYYKLANDTLLLMLLIDTTPIIDKYQTNDYHDALKEDYKKQLRWIDSTLTYSKARWKIVLGHHPIFAATVKDENERVDMQNRLKPILEKNRVDFYICGHIHIFQHIKKADSPIEYIVNASASRGREIVNDPDIVFTSSEAGFLICSISQSQFDIYLLDQRGKIQYHYVKQKSN